MALLPPEKMLSLIFNQAELNLVKKRKFVKGMFHQILQNIGNRQLLSILNYVKQPLTLDPSQSPLTI